MTRRHYSAQGTRFVHEVHPGYRHASRNNGRWHKPTLLERLTALWRDTSTFNRWISAYIVALVVGYFSYATFGG